MSRKKSLKAFRWYEGKRVLANVRGGDYAHAGEEEAIKKTLAKLSKDKNRTILDVGCGLGGTANFMQKHPWGTVTGIDIDRQAIQYAKNKYPIIRFFACDACSIKSLKTTLRAQKFDVITLFHSLCVFPKQQAALKALKKFAHKDTILIIFEYENLTSHINPLNKTTDSKTYFKVNTRDQLKNMLHKAGWHTNKRNIVDMRNDCKKWYKSFLAKLTKKKALITKIHGEEYYVKAQKRYREIFTTIDKGLTGGCIIYVRAIPK